ncbi:hypothetical protein [Streptomyces lydicus]|uniref:hypothetical protein n=1 Tax=Streptomyces lydicus TaxID=47763 RepID=UPI00378BA15A
MTTTPATEPTQPPAPGKWQEPTKTTPIRSLTGGQIAVFVITTIPMIAVGIGGAIGTYSNAASELHRSETAVGVVAAGEGATLVAALVMIGVTMLGQAAPLVIRSALWILPAAASVMGLTIASDTKEAVVYALTPLAMTASAEGISFLARRIVAHTTGIDVEAQRRNAEIMRKIAYHQARAARHPNDKVRKESALEAWKLMSRIGQGDAQLGSGLIDVQRNRLTNGADTALLTMLTGTPEPTPATLVSRALEPSEPTAEPDREPTGSTVFLTSRTEPATEPRTPTLPTSLPIIRPADQQVSREPVLSPAEPILTKATQTAPETTPEPGGGEPDEPEPGADEKEQQIVTLAHQIRLGEPLTKTTAAQLLGVSPATAGRRLKEARTRITEGTGFYT